MTKRTIGRVCAVGAVVCGGLGGCAAPLTDGDHHVVFHGAAVRFTLENAAPGTPSEPAIVFVHGWASARWFWDAQMEGLRGERRLIAIDLPGYGESEDVEAAHSFSLYADAIVAVLDDAGVERAVLVGHSNGVPTVRQVWRRYPERTAGLVAVDGPLREFPESNAGWERFVALLGEPAFAETASRVVDQVTDGMPDEALRDEVRAAMLATPQRVMAGGIAANLGDGVWARDGVGVPLLVINSDASYWTAEYIDHVRGMGDDVEYEVIGGVSHFLMLDAPDRFNRLLLDWLERQGHRP
jgi:pimeloyl-ACP methyl ester carboxylesterase